ncbi:MAG: hypothetical protein AAFR65_15460 [Pseudomonadota bacterium]
MSSLDAHPFARLMPWPPYSKDRLCGDIETFLAYGDMGAEDLGEFLNTAEAQDVVVLYTATENELYAFSRWLDTRAPQNRPHLVANVTLPSFFQAGSTSPNLRGQLLRTAIRRVMQQMPDERRVFITLTDKMAIALEAITGVNFDVTANPVDLLAGGNASTSVQQTGPVKVACPGQPKGTKGAGILPEIIEKASDLNCLFRVQNWPADSSAAPNVELLPTTMDRPEYVAYLQSCEITLLPYDTDFYALAVSAIFDEVASLGHGVVTTTGTWMANCIDDGGVVGRHAPDGDVDGLVAALHHLVDNMTDLRKNADENAKTWCARRGVRSYMDHVFVRLGID